MATMRWGNLPEPCLDCSVAGHLPQEHKASHRSTRRGHGTGGGRSIGDPPKTRLAPPGMGSAVLSDYCDVLATPDAAPYLRDLWDAVWRLGGFDLVNVQQIKPEAVTQTASRRKRQPFSRRGHWQKRCYAINCVWSDGEAWFVSLGKKGRNNFWRGERILTSLGGMFSSIASIRTTSR